MILLRTEEMLTSERPKGSSNYVFEEFSNDLVAYSTNKMYAGNLIVARVRSERDRHMLKCWPVAITKKGSAFLEAAKDEKSGPKRSNL